MSSADDDLEDRDDDRKWAWLEGESGLVHVRKAIERRDRRAHRPEPQWRKYGLPYVPVNHPTDIHFRELQAGAARDRRRKAGGGGGKMTLAHMLAMNHLAKNRWVFAYPGGELFVARYADDVVLDRALKSLDDIRRPDVAGTVEESLTHPSIVGMRLCIEVHVRNGVDDDWTGRRRAALESLNDARVLEIHVPEAVWSLQRQGRIVFVIGILSMPEF